MSTILSVPDILPLAIPKPLLGVPSYTTGRVTISDLLASKEVRITWPMLTAYDALTAGRFDASGIPVLLVGDSAAMVVYGHDSTLPVTVDELIPLVRGVVRGSHRSMVVADLPFGSYQTSPEQAVDTAVRFMKEAGAHAVKLEGGATYAPHIAAIVNAGIPVMGHIGLTPQSVHQLGGYKVQGRGDEAAQKLCDDARAVAQAGAFAIVVEVIPADLGATIRSELSIPIVGIGAGSEVDAQVLVWQDLVGLTPGRAPKFVKRYANLGSALSEAVETWGHDVVAGNYPDEQHSYS